MFNSKFLSVYLKLKKKYLSLCEVKIIKCFIVIQFSTMNFHIFLNAGSLVVGSWFGDFASRFRSSIPGFVVLSPRNSRRQVLIEAENAHTFPEV